MAESIRQSKADLRTLLEALGHTFIDRPYRKAPTRRRCWSLECKECGKDWFLRFRDNPFRHGGSIADFPLLGERCQKQQKAAGG